MSLEEKRREGEKGRGEKRRIKIRRKIVERIKE